MIIYVVYLVLGLLVALPTSILGTHFAELPTQLYINKKLKRFQFFKDRRGSATMEAAIIPVIISAVIIELGIVGLVNAGILRLSLLCVLLGILGLAIGGAVVGFLVTFLFAKLVFMLDADFRKESKWWTERRKSIKRE